MGSNTIDAGTLRRMFLAGAKCLELKKEWINQLNVFPVPDGDTGTNMTLTIMSAAGEVSALPEDASIELVAKAISGGSLRGARGNSGVILSQLFRGFTKTIRDYNELDIPLIASAMERAVETAYKAVMKPKEGTILTVARAMASKATELAPSCQDLSEFFDLILEEGQATLEKTPEMLPVLKEAGVVDSGGEGLITVLRGCVDSFNGKEPDTDFEVPVAASPAASAGAGHTPISTDEIRFGYCTEFIINLEKPFPESEEHAMKEFLTSIGDSLVLVADEDIVKVHVHTNHPGLAFEKGLEYGSLSRMKIDNMRIEHEEKLFRENEMKDAYAKEADAKKGPAKDVGFISVTIGEGMSEIFKGLGVDYLIEGGQTMNPSTDDMLKAIEAVNAKTVFILPNNKNVILAANQACDLARDCRVIVVPTKTVPQGITAMIGFNPSRGEDENFECMCEEIGKVRTIEVTYAVRDTKLDGKEIHVNDIMAIGDSGILAVGRDVNSVVLEALHNTVDETSELISVYNGKQFSEEETEALTEMISEEFEDVDVEANYGGQPVYYCILSVE
ncbi:MAG: DAK2 domain-containing protein [Lachnospiraceae bacterium]|nr:DAK2 domain-containing protein [Lachnospiraceae bacterium]